MPPKQPTPAKKPTTNEPKKTKKALATKGAPKQPQRCHHKGPSNCTDQLPLCCACNDERPHSNVYTHIEYIDGRTTSLQVYRWSTYCRACQRFWESLARQSGLAPENFRMPQHHTNGPQRPEPSIVAEDSSSVSSLLRAAGDRKRPGQPSRSNRESPASSVVETSHRASGGDSSTSAACNISVASSSRTKPVALAQPAGNRSAVAPPEPTPQLPVGQSPEQAHPINSAIPHRGQSEETQNRRRARAARRASRLVLLPNAAMVPPALPISPPAMSAASLGIAVGVRQAPNPSHLNDTFNQRVEGPMGNNSVSEDSSHPPPGARLESRFTATLTHSSLTASRARQTTGVQSSQLRLPLSQYFVPATELSEGGIPDLNIEQGSTPFGRNPTNDNGPEEPLRHNVRTPEPQPTPIARNQTSDYAPETHRLPNGYNTYRARDEWTNYAQPGTQYSSTYYEYTPERSQHRHMNSHSSEIWESSVTAVRASQKRASELDLALVAEEASILLELFSKTRPLDDNEHKLMIGTALKSITEIHKELHGPPERDDSEYAAPPEGEDLKVDSGCIICYSQIADTVLMPCKHLVLCDDEKPCSTRMNIKEKRTPGPRTAQCPICRTTVLDKM